MERINAYREALKRVKMGPNSLPSICFYTLHNAVQGYVVTVCTCSYIFTGLIFQDCSKGSLKFKLSSKCKQKSNTEEKQICFFVWNWVFVFFSLVLVKFILVNITLSLNCLYNINYFNWVSIHYYAFFTIAYSRKIIC